MKKHREKQKILRCKEERGITLIALVVTIIVLLILAGVSIMMLTGQNGILKMAGQAETKTAHEELYEMLTLKSTDYLLESKLGKYDGNMIKYLLEKQYIHTIAGVDGYIINVEKVLGERGRYGNGTDGKTDVYKLEETTDTSSIEKVATRKITKVAATNTYKKYKVVYYGKSETDFVILGYMEDNSITNEGGNDTNWDEVLENAQKHPDQENSEDVGIGQDGKPVNLDLWYYQLTDDGLSMQLGYKGTHDSEVGYLGDIIGGKIQGEMPKYIKQGDKWYEVTDLENTFSGMYDLDTLPTIPDSVTRLGYCCFDRL